MNFFCIIALLSLGLTSLLCAKPNSVLWICVDDMLPWLGCYQHSVAKTPHIDTLALGGIEPAASIEGIDLLAPHRSARTSIIACRDRCDFSIDRIRAVITEDYKCIQNFRTEQPLTAPHDHYAPNVELKKLFTQGDLQTNLETLYFDTRPAEEHYHLKSDPREMINLANDLAFIKELVKHRGILNEGISQSGDLGRFPESSEEYQAQVKRWKERATAPKFHTPSTQDNQHT